MRQISYSQAITEAIVEEMERDQNVIYLGECVKGRYLKGRVFEMPISEAGFTGAAVGAAMTGLRPIVEIMFCDFLTLACDQIVNQAAKIRYMFGGRTNVPLVIRAPIGGYISLAAQHSQMFEAWFSAIPGLKVVLPSTPYDAKGLLKEAVRDENPVIYFDHKMLGQTMGEVLEADYTIPIGKADVKRLGKDVTLVAYSYLISKSLEAATFLSQKGIEVEVVDLRSTLPIDEETILASVKKTGKLVLAQETYAPCSVSSEIAALVAEKGFHFLKAPIKRVHAKWAPIPFAENLENYILPQTQDIITAVEEVVNCTGE